MMDGMVVRRHDGVEHVFASADRGDTSTGLAEARQRGHFGVVYFSELNVDQLRAASRLHQASVEAIIRLAASGEH